VNLSESVSLTDSISKTAGVNLSDTVSLTDSVAKAAGVNLSESVSLTDSIAKSSGKEHVRVKWQSPVRYFDSHTTTSDFSADKFTLVSKT